MQNLPPMFQTPLTDETVRVEYRLELNQIREEAITYLKDYEPKISYEIASETKEEVVYLRLPQAEDDGIQKNLTLKSNKQDKITLQVNKDAPYFNEDQ